MYLGVFDPGTRTTTDKLDAAIDLYRATFGAEPTVCLVSHDDAAALDGHAFPVRGVGYVPESCFYVGRGDEPAQD